MIQAQGKVRKLLLKKSICEKGQLIYSMNLKYFWMQIKGKFRSHN